MVFPAVVCPAAALLAVVRPVAVRPVAVRLAGVRLVGVRLAVCPPAGFHPEVFLRAEILEAEAPGMRTAYWRKAAQTRAGR